MSTKERPVEENVRFRDSHASGTLRCITGEVYRGTANNFNGAMAAAGKHTIAEVEELVEVGEIPPEQVSP